MDIMSDCWMFRAVWGRSQQMQDVLQSIRDRGRDVVAIHNLLSQVHHDSPALLHAVLQDNLEELSEFMQGQGLDQACQQYGRISRRWDVLHLPVANSDIIDKLISNEVHSIQDHLSGTEQATAAQVEVVVLSDGEHVGHAGDLGIWCAASVRPKAALHAAMAGMHPHKALALVIDLGTDNPGLKMDTRSAVFAISMLLLHVCIASRVVFYKSVLLFGAASTHVARVFKTWQCEN